MEENKEQNDKEAQLLDNIDKDNLEEAELEDVLESVPPEHRKVIERMMISSSIQMHSISSPETAVMKKLTPDHIWSIVSRLMMFTSVTSIAARSMLAGSRSNPSFWWRIPSPEVSGLSPITLPSTVARVSSSWSGC